MKKTLSLIAVLAITGLVNTPAQAATRYVSGLAGVSWFNDSDIESASQPGYNNTVKFDAGFTGVAAIGCKNGNTRLEAELGYQRNSIKSNVFYATGGLDGGYYGDIYSGSGKASIYSLMGNAFYDIPVGRGVEVYGMAGVGAAQVNVNVDVNVDQYEGTPIGSPYASYFYNTYKAHETTFAYQFGAGVAIPISKGVKLDARYRYFAVTPFTIDTSLYGPMNVNASSSSVLLGLRVDL
ncbi:MAG TPA: outer membrane beta-barrel protein [Chlorobaculum sp.]|nr:outer membrane beta-barrel protein [Chlorobaculum sp.]